jgi:osmotically inducible protein OsmC
MEILRSASATWTGDLMSGAGAASTESGALRDAHMSFGKRFGDDQGSNPEELIAAAHAACFSMAFSAGLSRAGFPPVFIRTTAQVRLRKDTAGFTIAGVHLVTEATVPGIDAGAFQQTAEGAKAGCPVSKLLAPGLESLTLEARLVS